MGDRKEYFQNLPDRNLRRVEYHFDGLRMSRATRAHVFVRRRVRRSSRIAGRGAEDALQSFKHRLNPPEATGGDYNRLLALRRGQRIVGDGIWKSDNITRRVATCSA